MLLAVVDLRQAGKVELTRRRRGPARRARRWRHPPSLLPNLSLGAVKEDVSGKGERGLPSGARCSASTPSRSTGDTKLLYFHDGTPGSAIYRYDGDPASLTRFDTDPARCRFAVVGRSPET